MTPQEAHRYLDSFINYELTAKVPDSRAFKLDRVRCLFSELGDPQKHLKVVHVAGTKGKGSSCAVVAAILAAAGHKVGLYTSPHLYDYTERIRVFGRDAISRQAENPFWGQISDEELSALLNDAYDGIERVRARRDEMDRISFFEVFTVLAVYHFCRCGVDIAVLETGMGGRLDATNVVPSLVCGITPISLEHTAFLGDTTAMIAAEKAAIIKDKNQAVVVSEQTAQALEVIENRCRAFGINPVCVGRDIRYESMAADITGQSFRVTGLSGRYDLLRTPMVGEHQLGNIATAIGMAESLAKFGCALTPSAVKDGVSAARWPGRFEVIPKSPPVILDGAHHPESCAALAKTMLEIFPEKKITVVLGCSVDKDKEGICRQINRVADQVILTKADHPRAWDFNHNAVSGLFPGKECILTGSVREAIDLAMQKTLENNIVLVTGSLFVVGEARKILAAVTV